MNTLFYMASFPNIPNIDNFSNNTVDKLTEDILVALTPYLYVIVILIGLICLLLIYVSIMTTLTFNRARRRD